MFRRWGIRNTSLASAWAKGAALSTLISYLSPMKDQVFLS